MMKLFISKSRKKNISWNCPFQGNAGKRPARLELFESGESGWLSKPCSVHEPLHIYKFLISLFKFFIGLQISTDAGKN
jgi:hypothetical protein